jgi:hypothetical protein
MHLCEDCRRVCISPLAALESDTCAAGLAAWVQAPYRPLNGKASSTDLEARLRAGFAIIVLSEERRPHSRKQSNRREWAT